MTYKVIEATRKPYKEEKILYKGPSKEEAVRAYNQLQSLPFSHKRLYEGQRRLYPYEF